jgi:hypothetical protein
VIGLSDYLPDRGDDAAWTDQHGGNPSPIDRGEEEDVAEPSDVDLGPVEPGRESDDENETPFS